MKELWAVVPIDDRTEDEALEYYVGAYGLSGPAIMTTRYGAEVIQRKLAFYGESDTRIIRIVVSVAAGATEREY